MFAVFFSPYMPVDACKFLSGCKLPLASVSDSL